VSDRSYADRRRRGAVYSQPMTLTAWLPAIEALTRRAGAVVMEPKPRPDGLSLKVDWIDLTSLAGSGAQVIRVIPETYASQGTATVSGCAVNLLL
jgi:hypothetical protein